jgi:hypothetical protein
MVNGILNYLFTHISYIDFNIAWVSFVFGDADLLFVSFLFFQVTLVLAACSFAPHFVLDIEKCIFIPEVFTSIFYCCTLWTHSFITNNEFCLAYYLFIFGEMFELYIYSQFWLMIYLFLVKCLSYLFIHKYNVGCKSLTVKSGRLAIEYTIMFMIALRI